jgi:hypothetical protein
MIVFEAPYLAVETTMYLPNPVLGDSIGQRGTVQMKRFMDGTTRTYVVRRLSRKQLQLTFEVSREKSIEIVDFVGIYSGSLMAMRNYDSQVWVGHIMNNPVEISCIGRKLSEPGGEKYRVQIIFEGKQL